MVNEIPRLRSIADNLLHHPHKADGVVDSAGSFELAHHLLHHPGKLDGVDGTGTNLGQFTNIDYGDMTRKVKSIASIVGAGVAFFVLIIVAGVVLRPPAPLTAAEKRLVGNWNKINLPEEQLSSDMAFFADRTFHANDGQFVGTWWISGGQLHVKYHNADWREHWRNWQPIKLWRALRNETESYDCRFVGDERVELAQPGGDPFDALIRSQ